MLQALLVGFSVFGFLSPAATPAGRTSANGAAVVPVLQGVTDPEPPTPVSPLDGDTVTTVLPTLTVQSPAPLSWFHFRVMEEASVAAEGYSFLPVWNVGASGRTLQRGHTYHWSCRVQDQGAWSPWFSPDWYFTVGSVVNPPDPKLPFDKSVVFMRRPIFVVSPVPFASYHFQVWDGKTLAADGVTGVPLWQCDTPLQRGAEYTWTCRIEQGADTSDWFVPFWSFEVQGQPSTEAAAVVEPAGSQVTYTTATPNPFHGRVTLLPAPALGRAVRMTVYSSDGRLVREFNAAVCNRLCWDGRDQSGAAVKPGAYVCRISGDRQQELLKITKVQ